MSLYDVLDQIIALLRQRQRLTYRLLKREFSLDDETLEDLKAELIHAQRLAIDEDGDVLIWTGDDPDSTSSPTQFMPPREDAESRFHTALTAVIALLQREERLTYRTLKHVFGLNDGVLTEMRKELQFRRLAIDEDGNGLVWTGKAQPTIPPTVSEPSQQVTRDTEEVTTPVTPPLGPLVTETEIEPQANGPTRLSEPLHTDTSPNESVAVPDPTRNVADAERL